MQRNSKPKSKINGKKNKNKGFQKKVDHRIGIDLKAQLAQNSDGLKEEKKLFVFSSALSVSEFATKINKSPAEIVKILFLKNEVGITLNSILTEDQIAELCLEFGYDFQKNEQEITEENILNYLSVQDDEKDLVVRPPVVTIMGHVDHGKTSLLDKIRSSNITDKEHGGITQHIGNYQVNHQNKKITFLDTPGHEAFTKMRARGASVTDIVVLVVAADDGVMPQTVEAINHTLAADVKMIVFINKMDKPDANPDLVKSQLYDNKVIVEDLGGEVLCVQGSVRNGEGIDELLDSILLVAELMKLSANPNRLAYGTVIEAHLDKGYGPIASVLVQNGTLLKGDFLALSSTTGKVRIMFDDHDATVDAATPSTPVKIAGLMDVPEGGDKFLALKSEKDAKLISAKISEKKWKERIFNIMNLSSSNSSDKKVNIIIKTDVHGSLEAIKGSLNKLEVDQINLNIINSNSGSINESDLQLAKVSNAVIFGFNIKPNKVIREMANQENIMIRFHNVIYKFIDEVKQLMLGALDPIEEEEVLGEAQVQKTWEHSDIGTIAGCHVISGKIIRNALVRIIRDGAVIYSSKIASLKQQKNDVKEVLENNDCGMIIEKFNDFKKDDIIEAYQTIITNQHQGLVTKEKKKKR